MFIQNKNKKKKEKGTPQPSTQTNVQGTVIAMKQNLENDRFSM